MLRTAPLATDVLIKYAQAHSTVIAAQRPPRAARGTPRPLSASGIARSVLAPAPHQPPPATLPVWNQAAFCAVATKREGHRTLLSGPAVLHRRLGRGQHWAPTQPSWSAWRR